MIAQVVGGILPDALQAYDAEIPTVSASVALASSKTDPTAGKVRAVLISSTHATAGVSINFIGGTALATHFSLPAGQSILVVGYDNIKNLRLIQTAASGAAYVTYFR